jgi:hypothetical protein
MWHEVIIEVSEISSCSNPTSLDYQIISNRTDTGETEVTFDFVSPYDPSQRVPVTQKGKASPPSLANIRDVPGIGFDVNMKASVGNPLTPQGATPTIDYEYNIYFALAHKQLFFSGAHDWFPWHELYIEVDGRELMSFQRDPLRGENGTPFDLSQPPILIPYEVIPLPEL